jgi:lipopolysaccharide export system ATP-binding protein
MARQCHHHPGTLKLNADRATVTQDKQGNQTMQATGRQVVFRQKMDGKNEWIEGQANQLDYNTVTHAAVLTGNARVKRGNDLVIGNVITYNTETEMYDVSSGASSNGGRVTAIIQPKPRDNSPAAKKPTEVRNDWPQHPESGAAEKALQKTYGGQDVALQIQSGEVVGLLGPNGAGKTTSFYMIVGLIGADEGEITLDGSSITHLPIHQRARLGLGYLPQEASIFRKMTVEENITAVLEIAGYKGDKLEQELSLLLDDLNIAHLRESNALALSGGERRRVEIARVLATRPRFILLDEPFAGVDPIAVIDIQKIITFLQQRGIGVLITDHNVRETLRICDRAYIISDGSVLASGEPEELVNNEKVRQVYLGEHFHL